MSQETRRSNNERNKYGICLNDECPKCKGKEVQQIPMRKEFVCAECGSELRECPPPKKRNKKLIPIIAAAVVIVGGVIAAIAIPKDTEPTLLTLNKEQSELTVGECDTIIASVTPIDDELEVLFHSSNEDVAMVSSTGVVRAIAEGTATVTVMLLPRKGDTVSASCVYTVTPATEVIDTVATDTMAVDTVETMPTQPEPRPEKPQVGNKLKLSYGTYEGNLQGGQPHGNGTMYFKQRQVIPGTVDCEASGGERVIGTWRDGKINMGTWYRNDGNQVIVKLGQRYNK